MLPPLSVATCLTLGVLLTIILKQPCPSEWPYSFLFLITNNVSYDSVASIIAAMMFSLGWKISTRMHTCWVLLSTQSSARGLSMKPWKLVSKFKSHAPLVSCPTPLALAFCVGGGGWGEGDAGHKTNALSVIITPWDNLTPIQVVLAIGSPVVCTTSRWKWCVCHFSSSHRWLHISTSIICVIILWL